MTPPGISEARSSWDSCHAEGLPRQCCVVANRGPCEWRLDPHGLASEHFGLLVGLILDASTLAYAADLVCQCAWTQCHRALCRTDLPSGPSASRGGRTSECADGGRGCSRGTRGWSRRDAGTTAGSRGGPPSCATGFRAQLLLFLDEVPPLFAKPLFSSQPVVSRVEKFPNRHACCITVAV